MATDGRVTINFRVAPKARDWLDDLAHDHRVNRTEVLRAMLDVAKRHKDEVQTILKARL